LNHASLVREIADRLGGVTGGSDSNHAHPEGDQLPRTRSGVFQHSKPLEQVHVCLGAAGISQSHPRRYAAYVLNTVLGGGMSSRLFQEIREKRGKAYSVYSFTSTYRDVGYLGVYAGTSIASVEEVIELILKELKNLASGNIREDEIRRAKGQIVGSIMLGLESTDSWMSHIARNEIYFGKAITTEEICSAIRAVSRDEVVDLAKSLFQREAMALTLLGDFNDEVSLKSFDLGS
jgi:predicted Zn-dependent peptidase